MNAASPTLTMIATRAPKRWATLLLQLCIMKIEDDFHHLIFNAAYRFKLLHHHVPGSSALYFPIISLPCGKM